MKRVAESSGANYSVHKESAKAQSRVTPVVSRNYCVLGKLYQNAKKIYIGLCL